MERNTLVSLMLLIAAVMLAIGLFIAGSIWRGRASPKPSVSGKVQRSSLWEAHPSPVARIFVRCASSKKGKLSARPPKEIGNGEAGFMKLGRKLTYKAQG